MFTLNLKPTPHYYYHFLLILLLLISTSSTTTNGKRIRSRQNHSPCKRLVVYYHDILYNGKNAKNATSAIVGAPAWANTTILGDQGHFGDFVIFDDPITLGNSLDSTRIGRAQGFYVYDRKDYPTAWFGFSMYFNSTDHYMGTIQFAGADPVAKTRDLSVVGGTGDFFMARGIVTFMTDAVEDSVYFRLRMDIKLFECW